jgi:hypothetical protein
MAREVDVRAAQPVAGTALGDMAWNVWQSRIGEICGDNLEVNTSM